jgi:hypothetical protein
VIRVASSLLALVAVIALPGCFGLECVVPGLCASEGEGEGDFEGDEIVQLCDADGACFDCGVGEVAIGIEPNGSGCDGQIVCGGVEFRVDCELGPDLVTEDCACQIDRETISTFSPTELCEAENVDTRALNECGWTLGRSE